MQSHSYSDHKKIDNEGSIKTKTKILQLLSNKTNHRKKKAIHDRKVHRLNLKMWYKNFHSLNKRTNTHFSNSKLTINYTHISKYTNLCNHLIFTAIRNLKLTYLLTPWSRVLLEKLTGSAASQKIPCIFGTRRFITVPTSARHLSLS